LHTPEESGRKIDSQGCSRCMVALVKTLKREG
jgi:hypothetical protein